MTVVMYRSQQRGQRGQRIVTIKSQEVRSCILDVAHSFFLAWPENLMVFRSLSFFLESKVSLR